MIGSIYSYLTGKENAEPLIVSQSQREYASYARNHYLTNSVSALYASTMETARTAFLLMPVLALYHYASNDGDRELVFGEGNAVCATVLKNGVSKGVSDLWNSNDLDDFFARASRALDATTQGVEACTADSTEARLAAFSSHMMAYFMNPKVQMGLGLAAGAIVTYKAYHKYAASRERELEAKDVLQGSLSQGVNNHIVNLLDMHRKAKKKQDQQVVLGLAQETLRRKEEYKQEVRSLGVYSEREIDKIVRPLMSAAKSVLPKKKKQG